MLYYSTIIIVQLLIIISSIDGQRDHGQFRFVSMNIWSSGGHVHRGVHKIVDHLRQLDADIIALQEVNSIDHLLDITTALGVNWSTMAYYGDTAIITKHAMIIDSIRLGWRRVGVKIALENGERAPINVTVWCLHLEPTRYGPYAACDDRWNEQTIIQNEGRSADDGPGRLQSIDELLSDDRFQKSIENVDSEPVIVAGDLNTPSHLDWIDATRHLHCNRTIDWPVTRMLSGDRARLIDSYREANSDPSLAPGNTWSPIEKMRNDRFESQPEPQDRIDFIFYRSRRLSVDRSFAYDGWQQLDAKPNHWHNHYPSDHAAVVTDFLIDR